MSLHPRQWWNEARRIVDGCEREQDRVIPSPPGEVHNVDDHLDGIVRLVNSPVAGRIGGRGHCSVVQGIPVSAREISPIALWLYHRFPLSFREVEEPMLERGVVVSIMWTNCVCQSSGQAGATGSSAISDHHRLVAPDRTGPHNRDHDPRIGWEPAPLASTRIRHSRRAGGGLPARPVIPHSETVSCPRAGSGECWWVAPDHLGKPEHERIDESVHFEQLTTQARDLGTQLVG
ncbi:hypothetical protein MLGJGCBP_00173 [Rhodococcus sp. T7]|nr:hypothetical protein MLGJGCBP_00173 [Rhodococcus sp. T7]